MGFLRGNVAHAVLGEGATLVRCQSAVGQVT